MDRFVASFALETTYKRSLGPIFGAFAEGLRDGRLLGARTPSGRVLCPPREADPETGESVLPDLVEVGPEGTVVQATDGWALIRLDGADSAMLHRVDGAVVAGQRVRPRWSEQRTGSITDLLAFTAGEAPSRDAVGGGPVALLKMPIRLEYLVRAGRITRTFLEALLEKRLVGFRCPSCRNVYVPPRGACPLCAVALDEVVELGQRGTVTTFSVVRMPFEGQQLTPPYACAHVLVDGADVPLLHIVGDCPPEAVHPGLRVEAVWADPVEPTLASIRCFRPSGEPDAPVRGAR